MSNHPHPDEQLPPAVRARMLDRLRQLDEKVTARLAELAANAEPAPDRES